MGYNRRTIESIPVPTTNAPQCVSQRFPLRCPQHNATQRASPLFAQPIPPTLYVSLHRSQTAPKPYSPLPPISSLLTYELVSTRSDRSPPRFAARARHGHCIELTIKTLLGHLVTLERFQLSHPFFTDAICPCRALQSAKTFIASAGEAGPAYFVLAYIIATVALLPASVLTLAAGYLYGPAYGTALVSLSSTAAAASSFLISRYAVSRPRPPPTRASTGGPQRVYRGSTGGLQGIYWGSTG
eukprot:2028346-Pyramimonas_sp.AAC.3